MKIDWDNLTFSFTPTKTMYVAKTDARLCWDKGEYLPFGNISLSPAACVLNYGQGVFEGLKALRTKQDDIVLFRPAENAKRINASATRVCIPPFSETQFVDVIQQLTKQNEEYVPPYDKGSLYFRPCLWGVSPRLGVAPATEYMLVIFACPVGPYFKTGLQPIKVEICSDFHRAANKGTGHTKYIGNYAGVMLAKKNATEKGFSDCIYTDDCHPEYIEEAGAANIFCVVNGKIITPPLGKILPGITRNSIITLARDFLHLEVIEKNLSIDELFSASECFLTGTAATIVPVGLIHHDGKEKTFNHFDTGPITAKIYETLRKIQLCEIEDPYGWVIQVSR